MSAMSDGTPFQVRTLRVGGVSKNALLELLTQHGVLLNDYAGALFADERFTTSSGTREVCVAFVSLPELGLSDGARFDEILGRAAKVGLEPCPLEVAPHLRLGSVESSVTVPTS